MNSDNYSALAAQRDKLQRENDALRALLLQCALRVNTLRIDFEKQATHAGFTPSFQGDLLLVARIPLHHGYGCTRYLRHRENVNLARLLNETHGPQSDTLQP